MNTPILFLIFNRPDVTAEVFSKIAEARPKKIYISADGPRPNNADDENLCEETRKIISKIDWECDIKLRFLDANLGCKKAVATAIDWFFESEQYGIILEDDTVPNANFFKFCEKSLAKYEEEPRVMMISGYSPLGGGVISNEAYFSDNPAVWGWATWKRAWKKYDVDMKTWPNPLFEKYLFEKFPGYVARYFRDAFDSVKAGDIDTWDYQWGYAIMSHRGLTIKPRSNLVTNIGVVGAHSSARDRNHFVSYGEMNVEKISYPSLLLPDVTMDKEFYKEYLKKIYRKYLLSRFLRKIGIYGLIKKLYVRFKMR